MFIYNLILPSLYLININSQLLNINVAKSKVIPNNYIINLKNDNSNLRAFSVNDHIAKVKQLINEESQKNNKIKSTSINEINYIYNNSNRGYSATLDDTMINKIKNMSEIESIEQDKLFYINEIQNNAPWGLTRISSKTKVSQNTGPYKCGSNGGFGVAVYIIDTGIKVNHPEFEGRAIWGNNFVKGSANQDENGHGTHCAGTVGSKSYGVAKKATLIAVKVLGGDGSGSNSGIIAGIDWAISDARGKIGNVINLSLGGGFSQATNRAVKAAVDAGFIVVVAAGNENQNACNVSPASEPSVITVGATSINDVRASFSNYGKCLDIFAPGDKILSTWSIGSKLTNVISGTSMASPHVAGLAAYLFTKGNNSTNSSIDSKQIVSKLLSLTNKNSVTNPGSGSPNLLAYNGE